MRLQDVFEATYHVGDHVGWNSEAGHDSGKVIKVHTSDFQYKGYTHHATSDDPQYEIKSDRSDLKTEIQDGTRVLKAVSRETYDELIGRDGTYEMKMVSSALDACYHRYKGDVMKYINEIMDPVANDFVQGAYYNTTSKKSGDTRGHEVWMSGKAIMIENDYFTDVIDEIKFAKAKARAQT